jgi:hypothetical protein
MAEKTAVAWQHSLGAKQVSVAEAVYSLSFLFCAVLRWARALKCVCCPNKKHNTQEKKFAPNKMRSQI